MKNKITIVTAFLAVIFAMTGMAAAANISGMKFNDLNNNGIRDIGELGLANWTITLTAPGQEIPISTLTDSNGNYTFTGLAPGNYTVGEVLQSGWRQTSPKGRTYNVSLNGTDITDLDFGNVNTSQIISVGKPVAPIVLIVDLRTLPIGKPWKIGDPIVSRPSMEGQSSPASNEGGTSTSASTDNSDKTDKTISSTSTTKSLNNPDPALSGPINNFPGIPFTGIIPPDTIGDVGPNNYIQAVNWGTLTSSGDFIGDTRFAILDKSGNVFVGNDGTGTLVGLNLTELWIAAGQGNSNCGSSSKSGSRTIGDPIVKYDHLADRWILGQLTYDGINPDGFCLAVSRGANPVTDGWNLYNFPANGIPNDYPKLGVWPEAYYVGTNEGYEIGGDAWAFDRINMLAANVANPPQVRFTTEFMLPSDADGPPPPASAPNIFVRFVDPNQPTNEGGSPRLEMRAFHADFNNPINSYFNNLPDLNTLTFNTQFCDVGMDFTQLAPGFWWRDTCISQPGAPQSLEINWAWPMYRLEYRNFGSYESLVLNHADNVNGVAGIRWYELHKVSGTWQITQQGTYSPDSVNRWMGSIAMDKDGNIALGYSVSNVAVNPGIRYTGRLAGDLSGTLPQGELSLIEGGSAQTDPPLHSQNDFISRWGDYTAMAVDPSDDCTFWYTNEYYPTNNAGGWRTRIGSFSYCSTISGTKFNDLDGNGIREPGEPGLAGWQIDLNFTNGTVYKTTTTAADGSYKFTGVSRGTYTLQEVLQPGWKQTAPSGGTYTVTLSSGQNVKDKDFGNKQYSIYGMKFNDLNGNGKKDPGEHGLAGWHIRLVGVDTLTNTPVNREEITDANGNYGFTDVSPGIYQVFEVMQGPNWVPTTPVTVPIVNKAAIMGINVNFGNKQIP